MVGADEAYDETFAQGDAWVDEMLGRKSGLIYLSALTLATATRPVVKGGAMLTFRAGSGRRLLALS